MRFTIVEDDRYDAKRRYVDRMNRENERIDTLTPEQHEAIQFLASARHDIHTNYERAFNTESQEYDDLMEYIGDDGTINQTLADAGLPTIKILYDTDFPTDFDYFELLSPQERQEWEEKAEKEEKGAFSNTGFSLWMEDSGEYGEYTDHMEKLNSAIEEYLRKIDEEHGTHYAPTGWARMRV